MFPKRSLPGNPGFAELSGPPLPLSLSICLPFKDRRRRCRRRCNAASSLIEIVKRESIPPSVRRFFYRTKEPHNITSQKEGRNCRCKRPKRDIQASRSDCNLNHVHFAPILQRRPRFRRDFGGGLGNNLSTDSEPDPRSKCCPGVINFD